MVYKEGQDLMVQGQERPMVQWHGLMVHKEGQDPMVQGQEQDPGAGSHSLQGGAGSQGPGAGTRSHGTHGPGGQDPMVQGQGQDPIIRGRIPWPRLFIPALA